MNKLKLNLTDGTNAWVDLGPGADAEEELERFVTRTGRFTSAWVAIGSVDSRPEYVSYEQVVRVTVA